MHFVTGQCKWGKTCKNQHTQELKEQILKQFQTFKGFTEKQALEKPKQQNDVSSKQKQTKTQEVAEKPKKDLRAMLNKE